MSSHQCMFYEKVSHAEILGVYCWDISFWQYYNYVAGPHMRVIPPSEINTSPRKALHNYLILMKPAIVTSISKMISRGIPLVDEM